MAEEYDKVQAPQGEFATPTSGSGNMPKIDKDKKTFPYPEDAARIANYGYFYKLLVGDHFEAFNVRIDSKQYGRDYSKLRYVKANFAGLLSKILADMLFTEPLSLKMPEGGDQSFVEKLWSANNMHVQCYESALSNSAVGDGLFKLRVGKRDYWDNKESIIIEDIFPSIYYPKVDPFNVRQSPEEIELAWVFEIDKQKYLRKEIHRPGQILNEVYKIKGSTIEERVDLSILGDDELEEEQIIEIDRPLVYHIPNYKTGATFFGISDYYDLDAIFYAINNRMTKTDNILDKHSDPILMLPSGILDEDGKVKKSALGVIEVEDSSTGKPEYIVWDASLENAFKQVEKLVEFMYLTAEISPDILGVGQGVSDSGRALKFKLMRTIAKAARKKMYYDYALKKVLYAAQLLAKEYGLEVDGERMKGEPIVPDIQWSDGLPIDEVEEIEKEQKALDAGITPRVDAIMRVYNVTEEEAIEKAKLIKEETKVNIPPMDLSKINFNTDDSDEPNNKNKTSQPQK